eukprot:TRINITY_DN47812_c0_g1_i1.p1 TRINITY_DN47812_c0_g1~~TRINITY_DN47812_c0_g1_i1.p1  ORF type:complete len:4288 (-),score=931.49 TRINITY_DN47812_c0_g1_i1:37-12879(-)
MGGGVSQEPPPKAWETGGWTGLFCDPYSDGVLNAGKSLAATAGQFAELLSKVEPREPAEDGTRPAPAVAEQWWQAPAHAGLLPELRDVLKQTSKLASFAEQKLKDAAALEALIAAWVEALQGLTAGGFALVPCGWADGLGKDNHCLLVVEVVTQRPAGAADEAGEEKRVRVVVVNAGEGGVYHPASVEAHPKIKRKTALTLGEIPLARLADTAFLATLLSQRKPHECHKVEVTYDVLLPWLVDKPSIVDAVSRCNEDVSSDWRTPARGQTTAWKSLVEACRYILRRRGVSSDMTKQLMFQLRRELLAVAVTELEELPSKEEERRLTPSERTIIGFACRQLSRCALKEAKAGRLPGEQLAAVEGEVVRAQLLVEELLATDEGNLPPGVQPQLAAACRPLNGFELLLGTGEDAFRGQRVVPVPPPLANMMDLPERTDVQCFASATRAMERAMSITDIMLERARDTGGGANAGSASRLAIQCQVISLLQTLFTEVLPVPLPPNDAVATAGGCPWTARPVTRDAQLNACKLLERLLHRLGEMWQDVEEPTRPAECARAVAAMCAFAMFDAVIRKQASDSPMEISVMLSEGDGYALSTGVGRRRGLDIERASEWLELLTPSLAAARASALAYFAVVRSYCKEAVFDMPIHVGGEMGLVIEMEKYGPTCTFLLQLLDRCGLPVIPEGKRPRTEMDSIMMWFGSHLEQETPHVQLAKEHPEWMYMRNIATLFKFLFSMLPVVKENMTVRKERAEVRGQVPLTFNPGQSGSGRQESMHTLYWQTMTVRGSHHHVADLVVYSFYQRKLTWGEGQTLRSPADVARILERQRPTEEDILHTESCHLRKARHDGTLSDEEAEALLTCLVAPYLRVPLVSHFFASLESFGDNALRCGNRASFLFNEKLQALFRAAILEQGTWIPENSDGLVVRVPMRRTARQQEEYRQLLNSDARLQAEAATLGTSQGLLLNELKQSPVGTLRPLVELLRYTEEVSNCSLHSVSAAFVLFLVGMMVPVEVYGWEVLAARAAGDIAQTEELKSLLEELGGLLRGKVLEVLDRWIGEAAAEISTDGKRAGNLPTLAVLHAHRAILWAAPIASGSSDSAAAIGFLGSSSYVRGHHCYGQQLRNSELTAEQHADPELLEKHLLSQLSLFLQSQGFEESAFEAGVLKQFITGAPVWFVHDGVCLRVPLAGLSERSQGFAAPPVEVPEALLADMLQLCRRPLVNWLESLPGSQLDEVMAGVVCVALGNSHSVQQSGWTKVRPDHPGLYTVAAAGVVVDAQAGEVLYQGGELRPVPDSMSSFADFEMVFGREALQCAFRFTHEHRRWVDIIGEDHELLEWDAPVIDEQGVGAPSPLPGVVFKDAAAEGPPAAVVREILGKLKLVNHEGATKNAMDVDALGATTLIGIYFSAHWCPPCRGFTPKLGATYSQLAASQPGQFEIVFVSSDRSAEEFKEYFASMPWNFAADFQDATLRQELGQVFGVQGIPTLCLVTPDGHVVAMDGRDKIMEDPAGSNFPWGSLEPPPAAEDVGETPDAITYLDVKYNRPFVWYHPGKVFPAPAPDPEPTEVWAVKLLQPILEAVFPCCPPDKQMDHVLYMPAEPLTADAQELVLIGMAHESKAFATWKEVHVHRQWGVVHCFNLVSHGRRVYRTQVWSSHGAHCLQTMQPMHLKPACCPVPKEILDASGDWKRKRLPDPSLVIVRMNRDIGGRETLLPPRLLAGVVPGAFLDSHTFWQGEGLVIRGYPNNPKDEWFPYALEVSPLPHGGAEIVRREKGRLSQMVLKSAAKSAERGIRRKEEANPNRPPGAPVLTRNVSESSRLAPLVEMGYSSEQAAAALDAVRGPDGREDYALAEAYLAGGGSPPGSGSASASPAAPPPVPNGGPPQLSRVTSGHGGVQGTGSQTSASRRPDPAIGELVLFDLLRAPVGSFLSRLAHLFARIEDLGHVLVWGGAQVEEDASSAEDIRKVALIELPRLKLRFQSRRSADESTTRIYSLDHDGWYVAEAGMDTAATSTLLKDLLVGLPHSLILEKETKELQMLVPAWELRRPKEKGAPFGTHLLFHRGAEGWPEVFSSARCFLFPVHATRAFLQPKSLDALLYLILLKLYARQYEDAHRLAMSIAVDVPFTSTELWAFKQLFHVKDGHPDANALRLRLMVAVRFSPDVDSLSDSRGGWELHQEVDAYLRKMPHVTAGCMLTPAEELQAINLCKESTPAVKLRKTWLQMQQASGSQAIELTAPIAEVGGEPWVKLLCTSKELMDAQEWLKRFKYRCPAEEGPTKVFQGAEALVPIFEDLLVDDDMSGSTRQLGFIYLYMLAIGQCRVVVGDQDIQKSMAQILARLLQLKIAHWGKAFTGTEVQPKPCKMSFVLSLVFDNPEADWPRLPLAGGDESFDIEKATALLADGVRLDERTEIAEDDEGEDEESMRVTAARVAIMSWSADLKEVAEKLMSDEFERTRVNRLARRHILKDRLAALKAWACAPVQVPVTALPPGRTGSYFPSNLENSKSSIAPFALAAGTDAADRLLTLSAEDLKLFAGMPLLDVAGKHLAISEKFASKSEAAGKPGMLPFPVAKHPAAASTHAKDMLARLEGDLGTFQQLRVRELQLSNLALTQLSEICTGAARAPEALAAAFATLSALEGSLGEVHLSGQQYVTQAVELATRWIGFVPNTAGPGDAKGGYVDGKRVFALPAGLMHSDGSAPAASAVERCRFRLMQVAGLMIKPTFESIAVAPLSTRACEDLKACNPFLEAPEALLQLLLATQLHATRLGQAARAQAAVTSLKKTLSQMQQAQQARASSSASGIPKAQAEAQLARLVHSVEAAAQQLGAERCFMELAAENSAELDPRMLAFEFLSSFLLRRRQVEMIRDLRDRTVKDLPSCQQMIMGAGKTTVVGPMLALCLTDGNTVVLQTMPSALLDMTRNVLREVFGSSLPKWIFTLTFDRTQDEVQPVLEVVEKLELAQKHRGITIATPEAIKSLALKMIETLHSLEQQSLFWQKRGASQGDAGRDERSGGGRAAREAIESSTELARRSDLADACSKVLSLWRNGTIIMDEVDVLLHPLKSELNFPIGEKSPIDLSGERWELPIHLLGLLFVDQLSLELEQEPETEAAAWKAAESTAGVKRKEVLEACRECIRVGCESFAFQMIPHLVLMDMQFYEQSMAPIAAQYCLLWILRQSTDSLQDQFSSSDLMAYLLGKASLPKDSVSSLLPETMKMVNLAADWVQSYLPHCISRIDRVGYGLLSESDKQPASAPASRRLMAVPFLAKDVPSRNAEFAHPDVLIGLTVLAYRYEGLRQEDLHRIAKQLKADFARQNGRKNSRPASLLFERWKAEAREAWSLTHNDSATVPSVLSLELFQPEDHRQMSSLQLLFSFLPQVNRYYLTHMVFPDTMNFQRLKVSASGHELGSDMLFHRRIGFSGTPSNLLPVDLAPCTYEPGSDGKIIEILTNPDVVGSLDIPAGWDAKALLSQVANAEPPYHALIDTGALITGLENLEVAETLLRELPAWFEGVVYLDRSDRQMVLLRSSGRSCPLQQCGLPWDRRFTFYDQIHTTGMDVKQAPHVRAALTIGKDMVFRDYAQGAWRMRGIGAGQTISLMIIPEVKNRIRQDLSAVPELFIEGRWEVNVPPWLLLNSMRSEGLQAVQLNLQEFHNVFRKRALAALQSDATQAKGNPEARAARFAGDGEVALRLQAAIGVFREQVSHDLEAGLSEPKSFQDVLGEHVAGYEQIGATSRLGLSEEDHERLRLVKTRAVSSGEGPSKTRGGLEEQREQQQEREQEQQQMKEREQEEEQMSQFRRDDEQPLPWLATVLAKPSPAPGISRVEAMLVQARENKLDFPFSTLVIGDDAFYPLALFHAKSSQPQLPFPRQILVSSNYFRPHWAGLGDRRLKNISLVVDWRPDAGSERYLLVLSLAEAETVRRLIHAGEFGLYDSTGLKVEPQALSAALAVRTLCGYMLDATPAFRAAVAGTGAADLVAGVDTELQSCLQCLRFFHGEMFFTEAELRLVMSSLSAAPLADRRLFFEECLRCRRRERKEWADTPVARLFVEEAEWDRLRPRALVAQVKANLAATLSYVSSKSFERARLQEVQLGAVTRGDEETAVVQEAKIAEIDEELSQYPADLRATFDRFDVDKDGGLSRSELTGLFKAFGARPSAADITGVLQLLQEQAGSSGALSFDDFSAGLGQAAPEQDEAALASDASREWWVCTNPNCFAAFNEELKNRPEATICVYCNEQGRPDLVAMSILPNAGPPAGSWSCSVCTLNNPESESFCDACGTARGAVIGGDDDYE